MVCTATSNSLSTSASSFQVPNANLTEFDVDATEPDGRILVLSNCPETFQETLDGSFAENGPVTLHKADVAVGSTAVKLRLWFWHLNQVPDTTITLRIMLSSSAQDISVSLTNLKYQFGVAEFNTGQVHALGRCLAIAQMKRQYQNGNNQSVGNTESELQDPLDDLPMATNEMLGGVVEFDATAASTSNLQIRFVASRTGAVGQWSDSVWAVGSSSDPGSPHVRGTWPLSNFEFARSAAAFDVLDTVPQPALPAPLLPDDLRIFLVCRDGGVHVANNGRFSASQGGPDARENKGLYDVDISMKTPIKNSSGTATPLFSGLSPRCAGSVPADARGKFWGAANQGVAFPFNGSTCDVPRLRFTGDNCTGTVQQGDLGSALFPNLSITPTGTGNPQNVLYYLVVGGASDLPISLAQWRIQIAEQGGAG